MTQTLPTLPVRTPTRVDEQTLSPMLKWAGGKRWLVPTLRELWEPYARAGYRLVESMHGGGSVALGLQPDEALLNDINPHVINLYWQAQQGRLKPALPFNNEEHNDPDFFLATRTRFNDLVREGLADTPKAALMFYYMNRTCFNGLCRFNGKGEFNVSYGKYKTINYINDFSPYQRAYDGWSFRNGDFEELTPHLRGRDFLFADPPYDGTFDGYSKLGFTWDDQVRLAGWLADHDGPVVATNAATPRILDLYQDLGFAVGVLPARRSISCKAETRGLTLEMFATKNIRGGFGSLRGGRS